MARGPLPNKDARRRNAATIPTTKLPASGRKGRPPNPPSAYKLGTAGKAWWRWAWGTPQAAGWDAGALYVLARRAQLEDDLAALDLNDQFEIRDLLAGADDEAIEQVEFALSTLKSAASGRLAIDKEMRELDKVLGLTPKGLADLRWEIVPDDKVDSSPSTSAPPPAASKKNEDRKSRLALVKG